MTLTRFSQLEQMIRQRERAATVVTAAHDEHTLQSVLQAVAAGLIRPVLVGDKAQIQALLRKLGGELPEDCIVHAQGEEACAKTAVELIRQGAGKMLVKGLMQTASLLRAVVDKQAGIGGGGLLSHTAILQLPGYHKLLFVTDGGMVIAPNLEQKRQLIQNSVALCRALGYDMPKVAALCPVEHPTTAIPETMDALQLKQDGLEDLFGPALVEGPISFDLATDKAAARVKGYLSPVAGDADILLVPNISSGNLMVKALYGFGGAQMAGVVMGAQVPITVNSRGATPQEKYDSILVCAAMGQEEEVE